MRIAVVTPAYRPSIAGGGAYATALAEGLARRGHEVHVFAPTSQTDSVWGPAVPAPSRVLVAGVHVWRIEEKSRLGGALLRLSRLAGWRASRYALRLPGLRALAPRHWSARALRHLRGIAPDVVAVMDWSIVPPLRAIASIREPLGCVLVGYPLFHTQEAWARASGYDALYPRFDALVTATEHEKAFVESRLAAIPARSRPTVHVIALGVNPADFTRPDGAAVRGRLGLGSNPVVGYVGRLEAGKGIVSLLAAMEIVWRTRADTRLLLAGRRFSPGSPRDEEIQAALERVPAAVRERVVHLDGFRDEEKASIFAAMDVFAMPSSAESFGLVYLEAWMCARPVIGANVGATPSVVRDGEDGILVDPHDPAAIARAILDLLADPARRERMGQAGRARTLATLTWEQTVERTEAIYGALTAARRRA